MLKDLVEVLEYVRRRNQFDASYRYKGNELYDLTARMLFKERLHKSEQYEICFAKRGASNRTAALRAALQMSRDRFLEQKRLTSDSRFNISTIAAEKDTRLQAVDYFLWALQRVFERGEERYIKHIWQRVGLIHDVDDKRQNDYGVYYSRRRPLSAASIERPWI